MPVCLIKLLLATFEKVKSLLTSLVKSRFFVPSYLLSVKLHVLGHDHLLKNKDTWEEKQPLGASRGELG